MPSPPRTRPRRLSPPEPRWAERGRAARCSSRESPPRVHHTTRPLARLAPCVLPTSPSPPSHRPEQRSRKQQDPAPSSSLSSRHPLAPRYNRPAPQQGHSAAAVSDAWSGQHQCARRQPPREREPPAPAGLSSRPATRPPGCLSLSLAPPASPVHRGEKRGEGGERHPLLPGSPLLRLPIRPPPPSLLSAPQPGNVPACPRGERGVCVWGCGGRVPSVRALAHPARAPPLSPTPLQPPSTHTPLAPAQKPPLATPHLTRVGLARAGGAPAGSGGQLPGGGGSAPLGRKVPFPYIYPNSNLT